MAMHNQHYDPEKGKATEAQYNRIKAVIAFGGSPAHNCDKDAQGILKAVSKLSRLVCVADTYVQEHILEQAPKDMLSDIALTEKQMEKMSNQDSEFHESFLMAIADYLEMNKAKYERDKATGGVPQTLRREKRAEAQG